MGLPHGHPSTEKPKDFDDRRKNPLLLRQTTTAVGRPSRQSNKQTRSWACCRLSEHEMVAEMVAEMMMMMMMAMMVVMMRMMMVMMVMMMLLLLLLLLLLMIMIMMMIMIMRKKRRQRLQKQ